MKVLRSSAHRVVQDAASDVIAWVRSILLEFTDIRSLTFGKINRVAAAFFSSESNPVNCVCIMYLKLPPSPLRVTKKV